MDQRFRNMDNSMNSVRIGENKANQIVDEFLLKYKEQYRRQIDPLMIKDFGKFDLQDLGMSSTVTYIYNAVFFN